MRILFVKSIITRKSLKILLVITSIVMSITAGYAQHEENEEDHHHHKNEISIAIGLVPIPVENELAGGFHLHYIRGIGEHHRFGIGTSFETILDEHKHYTFSAVLHYRVYKGLIVSYAPGLLMKKENFQYTPQFAQHFEVSYEFELGDFHIGPVAEYGLETTDSHYMGGIHFGIDF